MKRKILVLTNVWNIDYISKLIRGAQRRVENDTTDFYIFNGYDIVGNHQRESKECEIYKLPDPEVYDGILVVISSADSIEMVEGLIRQYRKLDKKFICVEMEFENACYAGVHNYRAMRRLIEHMVEEHGCRILNFIGGPKDHRESTARLKAFQDCVREYNLQIDEERIVLERFEYEDGIKAYEEFKKNGKHLPDAVICANDDMAMGYCEAAAVDGYYAPEDYKIVGFDNYILAHHAFPSITSVNRNWDQLGFICMDALLKMMNGETCPQKVYTDEFLVFNESCGCKPNSRDARKVFGRSFRQTKLEERLQERQRQIRQLLCGSLNEQEMCVNLIECCSLFEIGGIAVYLNQSFGNVCGQSRMEGYDDLMMVLNNGEVEVVDRHQRPVPEEWIDNERSQIFLFAPLHFLNQTFGYCVMPYQEKLLLNNNHRNLMDSISLALENIHQRLGLDRMNKKLHELYILDSLTGVCNRCGYSEKAEQFYEINKGNVYVVYLDVDNLKTVNDTHGHNMGDLAIQIAAEAMKSAFDLEKDILVRMGGDEFIIIGKFENEEQIKKKMKAIDSFLEKYVKENELPFQLKISMGYVYNDGSADSIENLVQLADHLMYEAKQMKKNSGICDSM